MADLVADVRAETRWLVRALFASQRWAWVLPLLVAFLVRRSPGSRVAQGIGLIIGVWVIMIIQRRPGTGLLFLVCLLPFQVLLLALLYRLGLPAATTSSADCSRTSCRND